MADDTDESESAPEEQTGEEDGDGEQSFRERVEEIRQKRSEQEGEEGGREPPEGMEGMMGGGGPGGGMGGNPFAQMMGGMMGGGPGGGGMGGPGGPAQGGESDEELAREMRKLRDEIHDMRRSLDRIADALED
jgi:hypothetical protein